jgi:hypothetical protein
VRRRGSQHEEAGAAARAVDQDPKQVEQVGPALNLVDDDETRQGAQRLERGLEPAEVERVLEVEDLGALAGGQGAGEGGLAGLARADHRDGRVDTKGPGEIGAGAGAGNHGRHHT